MSNARRGDVNGVYKKSGRSTSHLEGSLPVYELDATNQLYAMCGGPGKCRWTLAHEGVPLDVYYESASTYRPEVPVSAWGRVYGRPPTPTVACADDGTAASPPPLPSP